MAMRRILNRTGRHNSPLDRELTPLTRASHLPWMPAEPSYVLIEADELDGEDVLPGFRSSVSAIL